MATIFNSRLLFLESRGQKSLFKEKMDSEMPMSLSSSVTLQTGALSKLDLHLPLLSQYSQFVVLSHPPLRQLYGPSVISSLKQLKRPIVELSIPEGESSKSLTQATRCWQQMFSHGVDRQAAIIALGGGVICDLAGFVASCYMRGLDVFYLPTTLLAMVDAALGGKTGVNLRNNKNAIGTFHPPQHIFIDPACLITLPQREFNSGLAEIIKYGIVGNPLLFEKLEKGIEELKQQKGVFLEEVITSCVALKNDIVVQDWKDLTGRRAILNYGHTFGHVIEALTGYRRYLHGEAVAMGMSCAAHLSAQLNLCDRSLIERQDNLCLRANLPIHLPRLSIDRLIKTMKGDKKAICGKISLILLERIGTVVKVFDVDPILIKQIVLTKME
jgi:3-dehydroquinate synthase